MCKWRIEYVEDGKMLIFFGLDVVCVVVVGWCVDINQWCYCVFGVGVIVVVCVENIFDYVGC